MLGLASAMGIGRFAFTPLLPLMQQHGMLSLAEGGWLAGANYLGYLVGALGCVAAAPPATAAARAGLLGIAVLTLAMGFADSFPVWLALRFAAGVASALVIVGVSAWAIGALANDPRGALSGWVFSGVGAGICVAGLVGWCAALWQAQPAHAWLLLGAGSAAVIAYAWRPLGTPAVPLETAARGSAGNQRARVARLVFSYGAFGLGYIIPATFLPAVARQLTSDALVFGSIWPAFGAAAAASTVIAARTFGALPPRKVWAGAHLVMAAGVLAPVLFESVWSLAFSALAVGGTFMVITMAAVQEAQRVAGAGAARLIATMTAAFAAGQLAGPLFVSAARTSPHAIALPSWIAAVALLLAALLLMSERTSLR